MALPRVGDIVAYRMADADCATWRAEASEDPNVNVPAEGDVLPALVLAVHEGPEPSVNLRLFLDGRYEAWAQYRVEGTRVGTWAHRPVEVPQTDPEVPVDPGPVEPEPEPPVEEPAPSPQES